uniref:FERM F1 lobe ubiquitin-like domain-containing protein n=1 Tax=Zonotrichia albicollis TaxID=44394 RepID=A0A8D2QA57_ZONAL
MKPAEFRFIENKTEFRFVGNKTSQVLVPWEQTPWNFSFWEESPGSSWLFPFLAGITPLCYSLFALYDPQSRIWLPPNHQFHIGKDTSINLIFRMRFYFRNWHGMNNKEPVVFRNVPRSGDSPEEKPPGGALLDRSSFEYLFEQVTGRDSGEKRDDFPQSSWTWLRIRNSIPRGLFKGKNTPEFSLWKRKTAGMQFSLLWDFYSQSHFLNWKTQGKSFRKSPQG